MFDFIKKLHTDGKAIMVNERIKDPLGMSRALTAAEKLLESMDPEVCLETCSQPVILPHNCMPENCQQC